MLNHYHWGQYHIFRKWISFSIVISLPVPRFFLVYSWLLLSRRELINLYVWCIITKYYNIVESNTLTEVEHEPDFKLTKDIPHGKAIQCLVQGFWRNIDHVIKVPYCFCFRSLRKRSAASTTLCVWSVTWCVTVVSCMAAVRQRLPALWQSARQRIRYMKLEWINLLYNISLA